MKYLFAGIGAVLVLILLLVGLTQLASERVEVVELHTIDSEGTPLTTRLWVVDDAGRPYLRVAAGGSNWYARMRQNGEISLTRDGETRRYRPLPRADKSAHVNRLMQAKYNWGDSLMGVLVGSREGAIPIELQLLPQAGLSAALHR